MSLVQGFFGQVQNEVAAPSEEGEYNPRLTADDALTLAVDLCDVSLPHAWRLRSLHRFLAHFLQNRSTVLLLLAIY